MDVVYILEHVYEINDQDEVKHIGVFSSEEKAQKVIKELEKLPGFKKYPLDCFIISKTKIDEYEWKEGFITWEEANKSD